MDREVLNVNRAVLSNVYVGRKDPFDKYAAAFQPLPGSKPVTLTDLERGQCRWPIGEKPTLCCALASTTGRYCPEHERLSGQRLAALV